MAKLRPGIDLPIIPEDFVASDETCAFAISEAFSQRMDCGHQPEMSPAEWSFLETIMIQCPES